jgi:D-beta-D-heptose 7-phosphate kinase/D-beta-D-heptose 1-phosphate adenosyltransferase
MNARPLGASSLAEAQAWREECRRERARVVFTNGCFDLLHAGHVRMLAQARSLGDALVVGLNSDTSVRRLKGSGRPVLPQDERAEIIMALRWVDRVVVFEEDTPRELVLALRPDALVKGADYSEENIVGAREVRGWGGEVVRVPLVEGVSTSSIVKRILDRFG